MSNIRYTLTYESSKQKNRFNLIAIVRGEPPNEFRSYTIGHMLSWAEMTRTLISWFNEPEMVNGMVSKVVKNGGK